MPSMLDLANSADFKYYGWIVTSTVSVGILTYALIHLSMKKRRELKRNSYPKDTVVLHQFPRSSHTPSLSTPCLKLETWLKMADIKYVNEFSYLARSAQGQVPFITLNRDEYHDSQFIIEHLSSVYDKDMSKNLTVVERSIARGFFKLLEESFKWLVFRIEFK